MALDPKSSARARPVRPGSVIGIAVARFHEDLTGPMKDSAVRELVACGVASDDIRVVWVPGSFELPLAARRLAEVAEVDAVLALGVVVKGETDHDHWVAHGAVSGLMSVSLEEDVPMHLGVLTCETLEQARARALPVEMGGREDKGREVARAALEMLVALDGLEDDEDDLTVDEEGFEARFDAGEDE
jgi:6,7-dimethyl-8-ribityllumazine synthase